MWARFLEKEACFEDCALIVKHSIGNDVFVAKEYVSSGGGCWVSDGGCYNGWERSHYAFSGLDVLNYFGDGAIVGGESPIVE